MPIGVHILGPGYGESIILDLPDNRVGVIDSFQHPHGRHHVLDFLRHRCAGKALAFLAVTHPHADHCRGLKQLLTLNPEELWVFDGIFAVPLISHFHKLFERNEQDLVEKDLHLKPGTMLDEILTLQDEIELRAKERPESLRTLRTSGTFDLCGGQLQVTFLTPGDAACSRYEKLLSKAANAALAQTLAAANPRRGLLAKLRHFMANILSKPKDTQVPTINPNLISGAMVIKYNQTRLLLLADAETPLWEDWSKECKRSPDLRVDEIHLLKVAHHGSVNGYFEELYKTASPAKNAVAVVTPFQRGRTPLPTPDGLQNIRGHAVALACTNRAASRANSSLTWGSIPLPSAGLPPAWQAEINARPRLARLLAPPFGVPGSVPKDLALPPRWAFDCMERPELYRYLHPDLPRIGSGNKSGQTLAEYDEFRVSFVFDDTGREDQSKRLIGWGAGLLS